MLQSNYQRVGALAGAVLFFGAWLTGYYNHWGWAFASSAIVLVAFWTTLGKDTTEDVTSRVRRGFIMGVLAALVARALGLVTMAWAFDAWTSPVTSKYDSLGDVFRLLINGNFSGSLIVILSMGVAGAFIAYAIPYFSTDKEEE